MIALADVGISVKDAKASAKWWEEKVGFRAFTLGGEGGHAVMVAPPGDRFVLHLCEGFEKIDPGNTGVAFVTDQFEPLAKRMADSGVRFPQPPQKQEWGGQKAMFADPDGNEFWLLEAPTKMVRDTMANRAPNAPEN